MKKFFKIVFIAVACCLTFATITDLSACKCEHKYENGKCIKCGEWANTEGVEYVFTDDGNAYGVAAFSSKETAEIYILPEYNGKPVTIIYAKAFANSNITRVSIPDSVTTIERETFSNCKNLVSATIGNGVTSIGDGAFRYCDKLKNVTIGNGVTTIGKDAFSYCDNLSIIIIPDSVTTIDDCAFWYCKSLSNVTMGNSVTHIGHSAFGDCKNLTNITVPDSIISISDEAFYGCNLEYNEFDNALYLGNNDNPCVILVKAKNKNITACEINENTKFIRNYAFSGCGNLKKITIPDRVADIGDYAFEECTGLTSITIPDSVTSIGERAFSGCSSLKNVEMGDSVSVIGIGAFIGCNNLNYNEYDNALYLGGRKNSCVVLVKAKSKDIKTCIMDRRTKIICGGAFENCMNLTSVLIPDSIINIGWGAFAECRSLEEVNYTGTEEQWGRIYNAGNNGWLTKATINYIG